MTATHADVRPVLAARAPWHIAIVCAATLVAVWALQLWGYTPCELCLLERFPYYLGLLMAIVATLLAARGAGGPAAVGLGLLVPVFLAGAALGAYHAGVEWQFWPGPTACSGTAAPAAAVGDFLKQLQTVTVVRCDAAALRVFGLSLAGWNVIVSLILAAMAASGMQQINRRS